jgi:hypothetical protein
VKSGRVEERVWRTSLLKLASYSVGVAKDSTGRSNRGSMLSHMITLNSLFRSGRSTYDWTCRKGSSSFVEFIIFAEE